MKKMAMRVLPVILCMAAAGPAYGAQWRTGAEENAGRWWYDKEDGTFARSGWQWIDGDGDGISQCYYFDENGWMAADTVTPDGYTVNADGAWTENGQVMMREAEEEMRIVVENNGRELVFRLNDSQAAKDLYAQLPLQVSVENFSNNEKIFYPNERLNVTGADRASGGAGVLAYYEPWGDVVMFYGSFHANSDLYQLGRIEEGSQWISSLNGELRISRDEDR